MSSPSIEPRFISSRRLRLVACCLAFLIAQAAIGREISENRRTPAVKAVAANRESVVNIHGQKTVTGQDDGKADGTRCVNGMGTGIVIDERGYIITNYHVVEGVRKIEVTLVNEENYIAQLISNDPVTDLAVIKINVPRKLPVITIGTSSDLLIGEPVIAVGNAYGYENTVTMGHVSALHRSVQVSETQSYDDLIQTDAPINPGNSGGPLLNIDGEMIGVNVAVRAGAQNIGFAIPVDKAMTIATKLMSVQRLESNWHGMSTKDSADTGHGALVGSIDKDSPAAACGVKPGDVILNVSSTEIARPLDLERALLGHKSGEKFEMVVKRNDETVNLSLQLAASPRRGASQATATTADDDAAWDMLGLKLTPAPAAQFKSLQSRYRGGMAVTAVRAEGPAAKQGIRKGDVLVGMHVWETVTQDNVNYVLNRPDFAEIEPLKFYILRGTDHGSETLFGHLSLANRTK